MDKSLRAQDHASRRITATNDFDQDRVEPAATQSKPNTLLRRAKKKLPLVGAGTDPAFMKAVTEND